MGWGLEIPNQSSQPCWLAWSCVGRSRSCCEFLCGQARLCPGTAFHIPPPQPSPPPTKFILLSSSSSASSTQQVCGARVRGVMPLGKPPSCNLIPSCSNSDSIRATSQYLRGLKLAAVLTIHSLGTTREGGSGGHVSTVDTWKRILGEARTT